MEYAIEMPYCSIICGLGYDNTETKKDYKGNLIKEQTPLEKIAGALEKIAATLSKPKPKKPAEKQEIFYDFK